jgi:5-(aminomethyl)-3-furanmethanol phosphate kinase
MTGRRAPRKRESLAVVKLGGSHASGPHLRDWLAAIASEAGAIVVVPGGGPFADTVRASQAVIGYDDSAAHTMALMAMAQFGRALVSLNSTMRLASSRSAILRTLKDDKVPVWSPEPMADAAGLPESWDLTSDSLAAWLTAALDADALILVKHGLFEEKFVDARDLVAREIVDPMFPRYLKESRARAWLARPADSGRLSQGLRGGIFPEIVIAT